MQTPDQWQDNSTYIVTGPEVMGLRPSVVVAMSHRVLDPYLRRHVDIQSAEMQQKLAGFTLLGRSEPFATPHGQAVTLEYEWTSAEAGVRLHQYQMYLLAGQSLYTLTATSPSVYWPNLSQTLIGIVSSFRPETWGPAQALNPPV